MSTSSPTRFATESLTSVQLRISNIGLSESGSRNSRSAASADRPRIPGVAASGPAYSSLPEMPAHGSHSDPLPGQQAETAPLCCLDEILRQEPPVKTGRPVSGNDAAAFWPNAIPKSLSTGVDTRSPPCRDRVVGWKAARFLTVREYELGTVVEFGPGNTKPNHDRKRDHDLCVLVPRYFPMSASACRRLSSSSTFNPRPGSPCAARIRKPDRQCCHVICPPSAKPQV